MKKLKPFILVFILVAILIFATIINNYLDDDETVNPIVNDVEDEKPTSYISFENATTVGDANYTYKKLENDIINLSNYNKDLITLSIIGKSHDDRNIYALTLGNANAEKKIVIQAGIHGREYGTVMLLMKEIEYYVLNCDTIFLKNGQSFRESLNNLCFCFVPCANPDGMTIALEGINGIKDEELKNGIRAIFESDEKREITVLSDGTKLTLDEYLQMWKANAKGVDLNRNYNCLWDELETNIHSPSFYNYKGDSAESEPETKAMVSFVNSLSNIVASITLHSRGNIIYWDCNQEGEIREATKELALLGKETTSYSLSAEHINDSSYSDYMVLKKDIPTITIEIGRAGGTSVIYDENFEVLFNTNYLLIKNLIEKY